MTPYNGNKHRFDGYKTPLGADSGKSRCTSFAYVLDEVGKKPCEKRRKTRSFQCEKVWHCPALQTHPCLCSLDQAHALYFCTDQVITGMGASVRRGNATMGVIVDNRRLYFYRRLEHVRVC
jgi:hypothetical protein